MRLLLRYLRPHARVAAAALACAALNQLLLLLDPLILRLIIDGYAPNGVAGQGTFHAQAALLLLAGVAATLLAFVAKTYQIEFSHRASRSVSLQIYSDGIRHSLNQPFSSFSEQHSGQTASRLQAARQAVDQFLVTFIHSAFAPAVAIVFLIVYAWHVHWTLVPTFLVAIPAVAGASYVLGRRVRNIQAAIVAESAQLAGSATELLRNAELVKSLGLASQESDRIAVASGRILQLELQKNWTIRRLSFFHGAAVNSLRLFVLVVMVYLVSRQDITVGQFFSLFLYLYMLLNPIQELNSVLFLYRETEASLESIEPLLNVPNAVPPSHRNFPGVGHLEQAAFESVSFTYPGASHRALSDVTFTARRGEVIAFVGPSGSGKTTLLKILLGLYTPTSGAVLLNGQVVADQDFHSFRERIGLVTQDVQLFTGTIRDNLIFVRPEATEEECREALQQAAATPLLARAAQGLDTPIGESGLKLSGGEKQRLAIARALLRRPDLLILDEATSALDSITEREVAETVRELHAKRDRITLVIAHRLSTIRTADRIYVLDQGRVTDTGTHDEMLTRNGLYLELWRQQTGALTLTEGSV